MQQVCSNLQQQYLSVALLTVALIYLEESAKYYFHPFLYSLNKVILFALFYCAEAVVFWVH